MIKTSHRWSGWPGAYCQDCGAEDASENALADDWFDFVGKEGKDPDPEVVWKHPSLEDYVTYLNTHCLAEATPEEIDQWKKDVIALKAKIKESGVKVVL